MRNVFLAATLAALPISSLAGVIERPLFAARDDDLIVNYAQFGTFPDGSATITRLDESTLRFYARSILTAIQGLDERDARYTVEELNCHTGARLIISGGTWSRQRALQEPLSLGNATEGNPKNANVFLELCREAGIQPPKPPAAQPATKKPARKPQT